MSAILVVEISDHSIEGSDLRDVAFAHWSLTTPFTTEGEKQWCEALERSIVAYAEYANEKLKEKHSSGE